jgi:hypothetical protein
MDIPIEVDFIRACARLKITALWQERIQGYLDKDLDWKQVLRMANHHRVLPLVYRTLYANFKDRIPEDVLVELRTAYQTNAARSLYLTTELVKILELFEGSGISGIPIKGPALAKAVYGDVTLRQYDDLDILVREGEVAAATKLLFSLGYTPVVTEVGSEAETFLKGEGECGFFSPCGRYQVDIHWQMVPRSFLAFDLMGLRERSLRLSLQGVEVRTLSAEDRLFLLSIHGMRHLWGRHAWICDLAFTIQDASDLDWEVVIERARKLKITRIIKLGLIVARKWYALDLPKWLANDLIQDQRVNVLYDQVIGEPGFHSLIKTSILKLYWLNTKAREGFSRKVRYLLKQFFAPSLEDLSLVRIPNALSLLYAILRPLRLFTEYTFRPIFRRMNALGNSYRSSG